MTSLRLPTKEDFERDFAPHDLLNRVMEAFDAYGVSDEATQILRFKRGFAKDLFEEIHPLAILTTRLFPEGDSVIVRPNLDAKSPYDASIKIGETNQLVEITFAIDGQAEQLRMEHLQKYKWSPGAAYVKASGPKHNRVIPEAETVADTAMSHAGAALGLIESAMIGKSSKRYPEGHWILVAYEDHLARSDEAMQFVKASFLDLVREHFPNQSRLFLVGTSGRVFVDSAGETT